VACEVIAPSLVPTKAGDRVKTDRRDAEKLARCYRAGELTAVWVPDAAHEALRDLVRAREAAKKDQLKARHRLGKFLLRHGRRPEGMKAWTKQHLEWIKTHVHFDQPALEATLLDYLHEVEHVATRIVKLEKAIDEAVQAAPMEIRTVIEALQALRGVAQTTAATIVSELGSLSRFHSPTQLMGYSGLVAREHSSGNRVQRGSITKTGNAHLRRVLVEAAWAYQHRPNVTGFLLRRQKSLALSEEVKQIAWKAQHRLHKRYKTFAARGKNKNQIVTGVGAGTARLHLGDRVEDGTKAEARNCGIKRQPDVFLDSKADDSAGPTKRRTLLTFYAARAPAPTRASSPRQLPTDHVHAVPTREYQSDQSSR
jgi:transposase